MGGLSGDLDDDDYYRRTIYGRVSRARRAQTAGVVTISPKPTQTAPGRDMTTIDAAADFSDEQRVHAEPGRGGWRKRRRAAGDAERQSRSRRCIAGFSRAIPSAAELKSALAYLQTGTLQRYAQVLLSTNEEIFWP